MANYYANARTNYFKVKDPKEFEDYVGKLDATLISKAVKSEDGKVEETLYGFYMTSEDGMFPTSGWNPDTDEEFDICVEDDIAKMLTDDSVAVFMEIGNEKMRYLTGWATAVNSKGATTQVSLYDIYKQAEQELGIVPTHAEY